ncbi:MAG: tRNA-binding protein [Cyclobacteriaceae bacterium]|nr:tRNA-binding protein [Cyclobacteriaceae bacterium]
MIISWQDFEKVELRIGTIIKSEQFKEARNPAYIIHVDLGGLGIKKSSAQITDLYQLDNLVGKQVICVTNFEPKQIGPIKSEVLITGFKDEKGQIVLSTVGMPVPNGRRLI